MPILGGLAAMVITTAMDATGLSAFSALALLPLMLLFWRLDHLSRVEMGFRWGHWRDHGLALLYPACVIGAVGLIAYLCGATDVSRTDWRKAGLNLAIMTFSTVLVAIVTEEGFFRGWLWGSLRKRGLTSPQILIWSSVAFSLWHISAATLDPDFKPAPSQVPVFLINAAIMGAGWGLLRAISGSIIVASVSHGIWNGLAYVLFGFGTKSGALGIANTAVFGPEIGILGLLVNLIFVAWLWRWWARRADRTIDSLPAL